jgi:archaellum component FlaC
MSEKKVVGRNIAIVLGVICIFLAACLLGAISNYTAIIAEKDLQIVSLKSQIAEKNITISSLNLQIATKDSQIQSLRNQIDSLSNIIASLESEIVNKDSQISSLKSQIANLNYSYLSLKSEYDSVKQDYNELLSAIEKGEVVAKSATWLSEDKRLNVTSEVIPEFLLGEIWSYTVRVTVTNVGTEPLSRVLIFLFPYKDGKLIDNWGTFYYSKSVENLYMGESYSYNFTDVPEEMTTYKVIAVAG